MSKLLWTQAHDTGPSLRAFTALAYDSARKVVLLFGGGSQAAGDYNDTWAWDGSYWTQLAHIGPPARTGHAMAFDSYRKKIVLFGGYATTGYLNDTWEWDGETWTQVADTGPHPRDGHSLAFDSTRNRIVLFGGDNSFRVGLAKGNVKGLGPSGDTWAWDGAIWTKEQVMGPCARFGHAMAYDSIRDRIALFGGSTLTWDTSAGNTMSAVLPNDTWEYDGSLWKLVASTGPEPRWKTGMTFNGKEFLLFGGVNPQGSDSTANGLWLTTASYYYNNTWQWDGQFWTLRQDMGPSPRYASGLTCDSDRQRCVLFGGEFALNSSGGPGITDFGDTWELFEQAVEVPPKTQ